MCIKSDGLSNYLQHLYGLNNGIIAQQSETIFFFFLILSLICDYKNLQCICSVGLRSINPFITYIGLCGCVIESKAHRIVMLYVKLVGNVFCYKEQCLSHNNEYLKVILIHSIFSVYPLTHKESYSTEDEKPIKSTLCLCLCICYIHTANIY